MSTKSRWQLIRDAIWSRAGVAALIMAPNAMPIALWFFRSLSPVEWNFSLSDPVDFIGQLILAAVVAGVSIVAGFAVDLGLVKIAVSEPTHDHRFKSMTFWVPLAFWLALCVMIYDYYSHSVWLPVKPSVLAHLAYPTASVLTALYWSWSVDWAKKLLAPLNEQLSAAETQLKEWFERFNAKVAEATTDLQAQVADLQRKLAAETERANEFERLGKGLGSIVNQTLDQNAEAYAALRTQHSINLEQQRQQYERMVTTIKQDAERRIEQIEQDAEARVATLAERIGAEAKERGDALQQQLIAEQARRGEEATAHQATVQQLQATIGELREREVEPGVFQYLTMKEAIEAHLTADPELSNDQLAMALRIKADQLGTFRSQVSQVRKGNGAVAANTA